MDVAEQALGRGDLPAALDALAALLARATPDDEPRLAELLEHAGHLGRWEHDPRAVEDLLDAALTRLSTPAARARVLHAKARLDAYQGRDEPRHEHLQAAVAAYREGGDLAGLATAQTDLAFPVGPVESLVERRRLAEEALTFARQSGDALAVVVCAGTLARILAELADGAAYAVWQEGRALLPALGPLPPWASDAAPRYFYNWARALVLRGDYATAARMTEEGRAYSSRHYWVRSFSVVDAVRLWRLGEWDRAAAASRVALDGDYQPGTDLARIVAEHLAYERERHPDVGPLASLTDDLVADENPAGAVALALLMRVRDVRREPRRDRGLAAVVASAVRMGRRIAWEDALASAAAVVPAALRVELDRIGDRGPRGPRAPAAERHVAGLLALHAGEPAAGAALAEAAEAYAALGEPYLAAHAESAAALAEHRRGRSGAALRQSAARRLRDIGADRSLALLLRGAAGPRALPGVRMPESQRFTTNPGLTRRESEVARLASRGYTAGEIAAELGVAERTVYVHLQAVKAKLGVRRKSELVRHFDELTR